MRGDSASSAGSCVNPSSADGGGRPLPPSPRSLVRSFILGSYYWSRIQWVSLYSSLTTIALNCDGHQGAASFPAPRLMMQSMFTQRRLRGGSV
jgi:hypothetical protein